VNDVIMTPVSGSVNTHTFLKGIIKIWSDALVILIYWVQRRFMISMIYLKLAYKLAFLGCLGIMRA